MINIRTRYGLVLAGGGTRGAYQVGAWLALKELGIQIDGIVGTSIGAINGALFIQNDNKLTKNLYSDIKFEDIANIENSNEIHRGDIFDSTNIIPLIKEIIKSKGIDNKPLRELLEKYLDVEKVYKSKMDFGLVAADIRDKKKSLEVFKEDIKKEEFIDYLLASACFPIFKPQKIGDRAYTDGGVYDTIPVNMLLKKGYKNLIVIDISDEGIKKKVYNSDAYIKIIRPKERLGGIFNFDKTVMNNNMMLGYFDTLKAFNKLQGFYYFFDVHSFRKYLKVFTLDTIRGIELAAKIYSIDLYRKYNFKEFIQKVYIEHLNYKYKYENVKDNKIKLTKAIENDKKIAFNFFMDYVTSHPKYNNINIVDKFLPSFKEASSAMIELLNYMRK